MNTLLQPSENDSFWGRTGLLHYLVLLGLFALGLGLRLFDLIYPPLDEAYRTLNSAVIARGMYYQMLPSADPTVRAAAISLWQKADVFEPQIFERLVSVTYLATGEHLWIPRLYSILFWTIGGVALYLLARRMTSLDGAIASLAVYLLVPLGVFVSLRFQPDPFMVMWILLAALTLYKWGEKPTWKLALLAGVLCGISVLVKIFAIFFIAPMAIAVVLSTGTRFKEMVRNPQIWTMAAVMTAIPASYYLLDIGGRSVGYFMFWSVSFMHLLREAGFYVSWLEMIHSIINLIVVFIGLAGVTILPSKARNLMAALWVGYALFGLAFPYQIYTHDYYSLILIPLVALSLAPVAAIFFTKLCTQPRFWQAVYIGVAVLALVVPAEKVHTQLLKTDSRTNWIAWQRIGQIIPKTGEIIALTNDYGKEIEYFGMRKVSIWPTQADLNLMRTRDNTDSFDFEKYFQDATRGYDYFLVTLFGELDNQPDLKARLYNNYPVQEGDGYLLFDLRHKKNP